VPEIWPLINALSISISQEGWQTARPVESIAEVDFVKRAGVKRFSAWCSNGASFAVVGYFSRATLERNSHEDEEKTESSQETHETRTNEAARKNALA
jgi:hypothetical protein